MLKKLAELRNLLQSELVYTSCEEFKKERSKERIYVYTSLLIQLVQLVQLVQREVKFKREVRMARKYKEQLNNYSMLFDNDGFLLSIKRNNKFYRFNEVEVIRDLIKNLGRDNLTISDLRQVLGMYSVPKVQDIESRILISEIIM